MSTTSPPPDRGHLLTEQRNPRTMDLDTLSVRACVARINEEDAAIAAAVAAAGDAIAAFIEAVEARFRGHGGGVPGSASLARLIYIGAGTSGRLGVLDASECPPTFRTPPGMFIGIIAGGDAALRVSSEGKEDERFGAMSALDDLRIGKHDTVLGIAAGGTTPYVLGALEHAQRCGSLTGLLTCVPLAKPAFVDHMIAVETGPEVVTGSTRMKAGTATKMVLNTISTTLMVRLGKVYENLMVDLKATNNKLRDRAARIVCTLTGASREEALQLLEAAGDSAKVALVMKRLSCGRAEAEAKLNAAQGKLRDALGP